MIFITLQSAVNTEMYSLIIWQDNTEQGWDIPPTCYTTTFCCVWFCLCNVSAKTFFCEMFFTQTLESPWLNREVSLICSISIFVKIEISYRRNRQNLFYLLVYFKIESEIAVKVNQYFFCSISKTSFFLLVFQWSKSIIHQSIWCICQ